MDFQPGHGDVGASVFWSLRIQALQAFPLAGAACASNGPCWGRFRLVEGRRDHDFGAAGWSRCVSSVVDATVRVCSGFFDGASVGGRGRVRCNMVGQSEGCSDPPRCAPACLDLTLTLAPCGPSRRTLLWPFRSTLEPSSRQSLRSIVRTIDSSRWSDGVAGTGRSCCGRPFSSPSLATTHIHQKVPMHDALTRSNCMTLTRWLSTSHTLCNFIALGRLDLTAVGCRSCVGGCMRCSGSQPSYMRLVL